MEKTIIIHRTTEDEPPKSGTFIVGRKEDGQSLAMTCCYNRYLERWNVGEQYWSQSDLAELWPFWMDIPDFAEDRVRLLDFPGTDNLSARALNGLFRMGVEFVDDLQGISISRLRKISNVGRYTLCEIIKFCDGLGVTVKPANKDEYQLLQQLRKRIKETD